MDRFKNLKAGDTLRFPGVIPLAVKGHLPGGNNRLIVAYEHENGAGVAKIAQAHQSDMQDEQFTQFCSLVLDFHEKLRTLGVRTPQPIEIHMSQLDGRRFMLELSPFVGESVHYLLLKATEQEALALCWGMMETALQPILNQKLNEGGYLPYGIDPIPRNFTQDSSGIHMVDIWPPKIYPHLEYPAPTDSRVITLGIYRHYSIAGIMKAFLVQLCRLRPEFRRRFQQLVGEFLQELGFQPCLEELTSSPANRMAKGHNLQDVLNPLGYPEIYDLREIACELAYQRVLGPDYLEWVFTISHFQDQPLKDATINQIKSLLLTGKLS